MKAVVDRIVQYANRYKLTNVETGEVLGTFDFDEVTGTVQQVGTEIDKELFDSIANDLAARVKLSGGELAETIVTFPDISDTAANVASGDTSATLWGKVKNWFSRLKVLAFKNKVAAGDFEAGAIKNADVAADAAIEQSKVSGLMTDYVASISVSGRTVTYKNKSGATMGTATTQDTTYGLASQSSNGLMSAIDKTKLDGIESGAQKNAVLGVKGNSESAYRTGNVNITKENIGLGNVDNTSDADKPVSTATQKALNGKANTSGTYPNMTVGKATADEDGNVIANTYALLPTSVTDTGRASGQWVVGTGGTPATGKTMLLGTFSIYDTNIWLHISGGTARGGSSNYTTDVNVFISSLQGTVNEAYYYGRKLYKSSRTTGIYYTVDSSRNLRIYAAVPQYGKMFVSAEVSGGTIAGKGSSEDAYPSGGQYIPEKNYADLGQVVRVDAAQSLTDEEKTRAKDNLVIQTTKQHSPSTTKGWYRVAKLTRQSAYSVTIGQVYNYIEPANIKLSLNLGFQGAIITQESGVFSGRLQIDRVRVCVGTTADAFFDVHISDANFNTTKISIDRLYNTNNAVAIETYDNWEHLGTSDTVTGYTVTQLDMVSGTNTSGQVYQQGSPVLVGDQSAIFESDGTTVKEAKKIKDLTAEQMSELINFAQNLTPFYFTETDTAAKVTGLSDYGKSLTVLAIPSEYHGKPVTSIYDNAFLSDTNITSITIPSTVTSIGKNAFSACASLISITIPDSVTSIGNNAFSVCLSLTSVTIPDSVTSIEDGVFGNCSGLTSITIPDSVTSIGYRALSGCSGLTSIIYNGTKAQWQRISKDATWDNLTGNYTVHCTDGNISKS